jgi:hypothetical protein
MPRKGTNHKASLLPRGDDVPICTETVIHRGVGYYCGQRHLTRRGVQACSSHVRTDRTTYAPGEPRDPLPQPRPCRSSPFTGMPTCQRHGINQAHREVAAQREAERKMTEVARKLIPDLADRVPITNPLEKLLELASEVDAFRESLRLLANGLQGDIRYRGTGAGAEQLRAEVAVYRQALKDTTDLLVAIARLDIEKMLARIESRKVEFTLDALSQGVNDAGLTDEQKRAVMTGVARRLRLVRGSAA